MLDKLLSRVFTKLPKLRSIIVTGSIADLSPLMGRVIQRTFLGLQRPKFGIAPKFLTTVLSAATDAKVNFEGGWFDMIPKEFFVGFSNYPAKVQSSLIHLKSLTLGVVPASLGWGEPFFHAFNDFLRRCERLQHLHLRNHVYSSMHMDVIGLSFPCKHVQSLSLENMAIEEDKVVDFFVHRQPTLSFFKVTSCPLKRGTWDSMVQRPEPFFPNHFYSAVKNTGAFVANEGAIPSFHSLAGWNSHEPSSP
jgi:hypothetical protein